LEGLEHNSCQCPHWGYVVEGAVLIKYDDGTEEKLNAGDVFYLPPGHTAIVEKDLKMIDFSPEDELKKVMEHIGKKLAEFSK
jgi:quercetin dioxygenase-like cupin family protein